jgi:DNA-3-methyladenine glycosylase II
MSDTQFMLTTIDAQIIYKHLSRDPILASILQQYPPPTLRNVEKIDLFTDLVESVVGQQLSGRVADVINTRLKALLGQSILTPGGILAAPEDALRACGLSWSKIRTIKGVAAAVTTNQVDFATLSQKEDDDIIADLTQFKGIGPWTAEMFLIFTLQRPDVFSVGDLGLRTAVARLYQVERTDLSAIATIATQWSPYRSVAARYLWMSLDNQPRQLPQVATHQ